MSLIIYFSVGIGWEPEDQTTLIGQEDIQLNQCQFDLTFTFDKDHTNEMFTQQLVPTSRLKSFLCYLLSENITKLYWQQFDCAMSFPQCHYDWSVTSDNNAMVICQLILK